mmetsp:Transcript_10850/g.31376  ORF Transcript_10850/g.31376 Transcript_10850/m.31376 type:complete len:724 (+) Transcript_10850:72-2243(+)
MQLCCSEQVDSGMREHREHVRSFPTGMSETAFRRCCITAGEHSKVCEFVDDLHTGLHSQIRLARRCAQVDAGLPQGFEEVFEAAMCQLEIHIDASKSKLLAAATTDSTSMSAKGASAAHAVPTASTDCTGEAGARVQSSMDDLPSSRSAKSARKKDLPPPPPDLTNGIDGIPRVSGGRDRINSLSECLDLERTGKEEGGGKIVDGVFNPNWVGRLCWDMGVILLVVIDAMVLPFQFAYKDGEDPDDFDTAWSWITTSFFTADIFLSFFTGYLAGQDEPGIPPGKLVTKKSRIARNYIRSWFVLDFLSTIPWGMFANALAGDGGSARTAQMATLTKIIKFVRFLRLMRTLRLAKLAMIWENVEARLGSLILRQALALFRVVLVLAGICHWNACIWWMVGQPSSLITEFMSTEAQASFKSLRHWTTVPRGVPGEEWTWLQRSRPEQYTFCFYWTLGVMRTMPAEVTPENQPERIYVMVFMFFAFSAFAICVALITQTFFKFSERKRMFDDDMAQVRMYLRNSRPGGVSDKLQSSVKSYLKHLFDVRRTYAKEVSMLNNLPPSLLSALKYERLQDAIAKLDILRYLPPKAAYHVSDICEIRDLPPGAYISRKGYAAEAVWILLAGRLGSVGDDGEDLDDKVAIVDSGCLDSEAVVASTLTVYALTASEVIRVDKAKFIQIMSSNAEFKAALGFCKEVEETEMVETLTSTMPRAESEACMASAAIMT